MNNNYTSYMQSNHVQNGWLAAVMCVPSIHLLSVTFLLAVRHSERVAALAGTESLTRAEATELFCPDPSSPTPFSSIATASGRAR